MRETTKRELEDLFERETRDLKFRPKFNAWFNDWLADRLKEYRSRPPGYRS